MNLCISQINCVHKIVSCLASINCCVIPVCIKIIKNKTSEILLVLYTASACTLASAVHNSTVSLNVSHAVCVDHKACNTPLCLSAAMLRKDNTKATRTTLQCEGWNMKLLNLLVHMHKKGFTRVTKWERVPQPFNVRCI